MRGLSCVGLLIIVLTTPRPAEAWCCRACSKCMCTIYGVCPSSSSSDKGNGSSSGGGAAAKPLKAFTVQQVSEFIASIGANGSRNSCAPGCTLLDLYDATRFTKLNVNGNDLHKFFSEHESRFTREAMHNTTQRAAHAEWLASHGYFGEKSGLKTEQILALTTRLRDALRDAGALSASAKRTRRLETGAASASSASSAHERRARRLKVSEGTAGAAAVLK